MGKDGVRREEGIEGGVWMMEGAWMDGEGRKGGDGREGWEVGRDRDGRVRREMEVGRWGCGRVEGVEMEGRLVGRKGWDGRKSGEGGKGRD